MPDLLTATQDGFFAALDVAGVTSLGTVYQHVPEDAQPDYVVVGDIDAQEEQRSKTDLGELHTVEIAYVYCGAQRRRLFALMQAGRDAIETGAFDLAGVSFGAPRWLSSSTELQEDGVTYLGLQSFEIFVQADD